ncbi:MAG: dephospho-CoA kinase [Alphaproteobacteria bacterium]
MVILGLTGSIAMGKSVAARMFAAAGAAVFDADAAVHALIGPGGAAVAAVDAAFPGCTRATEHGREIDRGALAARVFGDAAATARLEGILHPRVREAEARFLRRAAARRRRLVVLDVPLLLETGGERGCDAVAVVIAPGFVQASRVRGRAGMSPERVAAVHARQMPDRDKLRRADFVIPTGLGRGVTLRRVRHIVTMLAHRKGRRWPPRGGSRRGRLRE